MNMMEKDFKPKEYKEKSPDTLEKERIFQDILDKRRGYEDRRKPTPTIDEINNLVKDLPQTVARNLLRDADYLKSRAVDDAAFRDLFSREAKRVWGQYMVERFGMPSKIFAKEEVKHFIDMLLSNDASLDDFKKVARISIDVNGLKAVNDLNRGDHSKGDIFLEIVARVIKDEQIIAIFKEQGVTLIPTSDGGDEFGIVVTADYALDKNILDAIMRSVNEELLSSETTEEVQKTLDFKDESVVAAFGGFSQDEWKAKTREEKDIEIKRLEVPKDFIFQARTSMGATTLYDTFLTMDGGKHEIRREDNYEKILEKLMGGVFSKSDENMQEFKEEFKSSLMDSNDPKEKFLSLVYSRNESEREISRELDEMKKKLEDAGATVELK